MSEFDFPRNWSIKVGSTSIKNGQRIDRVVHFENKTRPEIMRWLTENGIVSYKIESS